MVQLEISFLVRSDGMIEAKSPSPCVSLDLLQEITCMYITCTCTYNSLLECDQKRILCKLCEYVYNIHVRAFHAHPSLSRAYQAVDNFIIPVHVVIVVIIII